MATETLPSQWRARVPMPVPGVVLYAPGSPKSQVLFAFARELRARGWRTRGVVVDTLYNNAGQKSGLDLIDIANDSRLPLSRPDTKGITIGRWVLDPAVLAEGDARIRQAVAEGADFIVVDKFGPLESGSGGFMCGLRAALGSNVPLLVALRGEFLGGWDGFAGLQSVMVRPDMASLWRWWGPYRLYEELARGVADEPARRVLVGINWTLVEGPLGCGLAHSPARDAPGCRPLADPGRFAGQSLRMLAQLATSWNPFEAGIGIAAINAHYNRRDLVGASANGLDLFAETTGRKFVIGRFPELSTRIPAAIVLERVPGPGDLPAHAADWVLPEADAIAITSSALGNLTLPHLLDLRRDARVALVGPGTPLTGRLHAYGVTWLSGFIVEDAGRAASIVAEGGATKALKACGRRVTLVAAGEAGDTASATIAGHFGMQ
ncbi:MAG TPA: DUF2478 domain-containing protein [Alphaproteobacteria bacterium]|nr:DUF2478 domain-containing protein [Alphaproteobacteria bacterium]